MVKLIRLEKYTNLGFTESVEYIWCLATIHKFLNSFFENFGKIGMKAVVHLQVY